MCKKLKRDIGARLKRSREELGLSQRKMAKALMASRSTYAKNEEGKYFPSVRILHTLGVDRDVSMDWLICQRGGMFDHRSQLSGEVMDFLSGNGQVEELLFLMKRVPLLNHRIMEEYHQFKKDNPQLVAEALKQETDE